MSKVNLSDFLDHVNRGAAIEGGSKQHQFMHAAGQDALRILAELNTVYRTPQEVRALLADEEAPVTSERHAVREVRVLDERGDVSVGEPDPHGWVRRLD